MLKGNTQAENTHVWFYEEIVKPLPCKMVLMAVSVATLFCETACGTEADYVQLTRSDGRYDGNEYFSLMPGCEYVNWSDGQSIHQGATYYVGPGLRACSDVAGSGYSIDPTIMLAGEVLVQGGYSATYSFGDLRVLPGGCLNHFQINLKKGNITILSEDSGNPARLLFSRTEANGTYRLGAKVCGSEASRLLFTNQYASALGSCLQFCADSDWEGFRGTLAVADGLGIQNVKGVAVVSPGRFHFGNGAKVDWSKDNAPLSLGELTFGANASMTNAATSAINVSGLLSIGENGYWLCRAGGTIGHLRLGEGTKICSDGTSVPVFNVSRRIELGEGTSIDLLKTNPMKGMAPAKVLVMKLAPDSVAAGLPDFSKVRVRLGCYYESWAGQQPDVGGKLVVEDDPDVSGGKCVYATHSPIIRYIGENEWGGDLDCMDPDADHFANWEDGLYPHGDSLYAITSRTDIVFADADSAHPNRTAVFPGGGLLCDDLVTLYTLADSAYVSNLVMHARTAIYVRGANNQHFGGKILVSAWAKARPMDNVACIRMIGERTFHLDSAISGDGALEIQSYYPIVSGGATIHMTGDNRNWSGALCTSWFMNGDSPDADEMHHTRIVVGDAKSLGGDSDLFAHNKITLSDYAEIRFTNTTAMAAANRGLYVNGNATINVDGGCTATFSQPLTLNGTLRKTGTGTLGLGGKMRYGANDDIDDETPPTSGANAIVVKAGSIKAKNVSGVDISFEAGTAVATDFEYGALDVSDAMVTIADTLYVGADANAVMPPEGESLTLPVVRMTDGQSAAIGHKLRAKRVWKGLAATLLRESADGVTIYSVRYSRIGTCVTIR